MGFETQDIEQKVLVILNALGDSQDASGSTVIARRLKDRGVDLSERAVRYHLRMLDERGLTQLVSKRDGRIITRLGEIELKKAMVTRKVGSALSRIQTLAFNTTFNPEKRAGLVPINISLFKKKEIGRALKAMAPVFQTGLCVSELVYLAGERENIGGLTVPEGMVGFCTVCSIVVNGTLLKAGVPIDSKFGGILQIHNHSPLRFVELISYGGSSLDPTEIFIRANMTSVSSVAEGRNGEILANFRDIPAVCQPLVVGLAQKLKEVGIGGILLMGKVSEPVCEIPVDLNRTGIILVGGLNPVAAAAESGIVSESHAMSTVIDYQRLTKIYNISL